MSKSRIGRGLAALLEDKPRGNEDMPHKFINFKKIIDLTGINQDKLYNNLKGEYSSLTDEEIKKIVDVLFPKLVRVFKRFGYILDLKRLPGGPEGRGSKRTKSDAHA